MRAPRAFRVTLALVASALLLQSCAHIPLGTMWAMRNFSPRDFVGLDPTGLRAAVNLPDDWRLQPEGHVLEMDAKIESGRELASRVPLTVEMSLRDSADLDAVRDAHWHVLKVAPAGMAEFARLQAFIAGIPEGSHGSFQLNVVPKMDPSPEAHARFMKGGRIGTLSVALKLSPERDWLVLVDGYPLKADAPAAGATP